MDTHALETATRLAEAVEAKDPFTRGHARAVSVASVAVGQEMGLKGDHLDLLEVAGLLHDIGYVEIDPSILTKPGSLTQIEFESIRTHPEVGAAIVRSIPSLRDAADFIRYHHERCDGTGYPAGARKDDTPVEGRILAVAETFDALTAHRAHRDAFPPVKVIRGLKTASRSQLDPEVIEALLTVLQRAAGGRDLETVRELPSLDEVVGAEQRRLRETYVGISESLIRLFDQVMGHATRDMLETHVNDLLRGGGIRLALKQGAIEDRLPSRAQANDLASDYRLALAQQIAHVERWLGSRLTRYYLAIILNHLGPEAIQVCRTYHLCEVPALQKNPQRVPDSPLVFAN